MNEYVLGPIGRIRSELKNTEDAPLFYTEGAPNAHLELNRWRGGISYRPNVIGPVVPSSGRNVHSGLVCNRRGCHQDRLRHLQLTSVPVL